MNHNKEDHLAKNEHFLNHSIFYNLPLIAFALDTKGYIHSASKLFIEKWANTRSVFGRRLDEVLEKDLLNQMKDPLIAAYSGHHIDCEINLKSDGQNKRFYAAINPTTVKAGNGCVVTANEDEVLFDVIYKNNKHQITEYLKDSIDNIDTGIALFDNDRALLVWNPAFEALNLFPKNHLQQGVQLKDVNQSINALGVFDDQKDAGYFDTNERILRTHNHATISIKQHYLPKGGLCVTYKDISEPLRTKELLEHQLTHDDLTGLPDYHSALQKIAANIDNSNQKTHLVFIDIDHFKLINEMYGYHMGDRILQEFTQRVQSFLGKNSHDSLARLSHDEFLLLIGSVNNKREIENKIQDLMKVISKAFNNEEYPIYISVTAGICEYPEEDNSIEKALAHAEAAMMQAKALGRNRYMFYNDTIGYHLKRRAMLSHDMKTALQEDISSFTTVFQPIYNIENNSISSAEILLRWGNKNHGKIQPAEFIKVAEDTGLIIDLGDILIDKMVNSFKRLHKIKPDMNLSMNVSPLQLTNNNFVDSLFAAIKKNKIDPKHLIIELTESELLDNSEMTGKLLKKLDKMGCRIAIDDFGTGYSSLSYIRSYPFSIIKIDQSFIRHIPKNKDYNSLVQAVTDIATAFKMDVVAEGIETLKQLEHLQSINCKFGQGYHFAKPMPLDQLETLLNEELEEEAES